MQAKIDELDEYFTNNSSLGIEFKDLMEIFSPRGYDKNSLQQILNYLRAENRIYVIKNTFNPASLVNNYQQVLIRHLKNHSEGISVAEFRDLIKGNRATALLLLEFFDEQGITLRQGNSRVFTKRFKDSISN